ncbi:hypothetical protein [uncultured Winogradskyella sp.]|jgi:hypothetical protein
MKTQPNLPEPAYDNNSVVSNVKNTVQLVSNVFKLARKIFML